jgi:hypothetical protein
MFCNFIAIALVTFIRVLCMHSAHANLTINLQPRTLRATITHSKSHRSICNFTYTYADAHAGVEPRRRRAHIQ